MSCGGFLVRKARVEDVEHILKIQRSSYSDELIEDKMIFEAIIDCGSSYLAIDEDEGAVVAYLLTHPIQDINVPPSLHHMETLNLGTSSGDYWHIHDMTVIPYYRKRGIAKALLHAFFEELANVKEISLVSINDQSHLFWGRYGFVEIECDHNILDSYGQKNAQYMILERD